MLFHFIEVVVAGAANVSADACQYTPADSKAAIAVGAIDKNDQMIEFSNYGKCFDVFALGEEINTSSFNQIYEELWGVL